MAPTILVLTGGVSNMSRAKPEEATGAAPVAGQQSHAAMHAEHGQWRNENNLWREEIALW